MSVPSKNTVWGKVVYEGKIYEVLDGFHLSEEMWEKYNQYDGKTGCIKSTAPWATTKVSWSIEEDKLYLTGLCREGLLTKLFGSEKILADWIDEMKLLVNHRKVCKTYERRDSYLNEMDTLHLLFNQGNIVNKQNKTELYTSLELKNYIDNGEEDEVYWSPPYATLRMESMDLLDYLKNKKTRQAEDQIFPVMINFIDQMIQKGSENDISLSVEDVKNVLKLKQGTMAVFGSAKGKDIEKIVASLVYSMTDEVLKAKGCLIHLTMNKDYPMENIKSIVNGFESKLGFDKEDPLDAYFPDRNPFIFGTCLSDEMGDGEVLIRVLLSI